MTQFEYYIFPLRRRRAFREFRVTHCAYIYIQTKAEISRFPQLGPWVCVIHMFIFLLLFVKYDTKICRSIYIYNI